MVKPKNMMVSFNYMDIETIIKGEIKFEDHALSFINATMHVYLENVSVVDASSEVVGFYVRKNVNFPNNRARTLSFEITGRDLDERESYSIRAHIDINGDGSISKGDFISMQSYPVATFGHPCQISVLVRQVQ
jgi:hypothetical protein